MGIFRPTLGPVRGPQDYSLPWDTGSGFGGDDGASIGPPAQITDLAAPTGVTIGGTLTWTAAPGSTSTQFYRDGVASGAVTTGYTLVAADIGPVLDVRGVNLVGTGPASNTLQYDITTDLGAKLKGYFRGDMGITLAGSNVIAWANQVGIALDLTQGTAMLQPTMTTIGGRAAVLFDGTDDQLVGPALSNFITTTAYHVIAQHLPIAIVGTSIVPYLNDGSLGESGDWWGQYWRKNGANYEAQGFHFDFAAETATGVGVVLGAANATDWSFDGSTISMQVGVAAVGTQAATTRGGGSAATMNAGYTGVVISVPFTGAIGLLIICNAVLSAGQKANARAFSTFLYGGAT